MNVIDVVLIVVAVAAAIHGLRLGAIIQVLTFGGFLVGLALGAFLAGLIAPAIHQPTTKTVVALLLVLVPAVALAVGGRVLGGWSHVAVQRRHLGRVDGILGVGVAVVAVLLSAWLVANVVSQSRLTWLDDQIQHSSVLKAVERVMPPAPDVVARVQALLANSGFPSVFAQLVPPTASPVPVLSDAAAQALGLQVAGSMVKVQGQACGYVQEGSGFTVGPGLVVTNAHVIAGEPSTQIQVGGATYGATPVLFDPEYDLAVLRTSAPLGRALTLDPGEVDRGTQGAVLGYPENGPLTVGSAGVAAKITAVGRDIYNQGSVVRTVYQIDATVQPGNSGGPLVTTGGQVIGVVFSRSTTMAGVGYALTSPGVLERVQKAETSYRPVGTGACTEG